MLPHDQRKRGALVAKMNLNCHRKQCVLMIAVITAINKYSRDELDPAEEPVNFLEVDDVAPYLKFEQDDKGGFTLLGGPLDALIAYAASTSSSGKMLIESGRGSCTDTCTV